MTDTKQKYSDKHYPRDVFKTLDEGIRMIADAAYQQGWDDCAEELSQPSLTPVYDGVAPGSCSKCGAPYTYPTGPWMSILPPSPIPSCGCWNVKTITTTGTKA